MRINGTIKYRKALFIDKNSLNNFSSILYGFCEKINYAATTISNNYISFDSFEELSNYENYGKNRIKFLVVTGYGNTSRINISFEYYDSKTRFFGYYSTFKCNYELDNYDDEQKLNNRINEFLKKNTPDYWLLAKIRLCGLVFIPSILLAYYYLLTGSNNNGKNLSFAEVVTTSIAGITIFVFICLIDRKLLDSIFPAIVFNIGDEIKRQEKFKEFRKNILWGVVMAIIVGILTEIINKAIFKTI